MISSISKIDFVKILFVYTYYNMLFSENVKFLSKKNID